MLNPAGLTQCHRESDDAVEPVVDLRDPVVVVGGVGITGVRFRLEMVASETKFGMKWTDTLATWSFINQSFVEIINDLLVCQNREHSLWGNYPSQTK